MRRTIIHTMNHVTVKKLGLSIGEVTLFFQKH